MVSIVQLYSIESRRLEQSLEADRDTTAALDSVRGCLGRIQQDYIAQQDDPALRRQAGYLFATAHSTAALLVSASQVDISLRLAQPAAPQALSTKTRQRIGQYLPFILCVLTSVMLFAKGNIFMIILSLAATLTVGYQAWRIQAPKREAAALPEAHGTVKVDPAALLQSLEAVCVTMDRVLAEQAAQQSGEAHRPVWTQEQLAAVQILWESIQAHDGEYALKAAPGLLDALDGQNIRLLTYSPETKQYFETVPGARGGQTIRPALVSGNTVLARGQVTVPMNR